MPRRTDCLEAVLLVNGNDECLAEEGLLVDRMRFLLGSVGVRDIHYVPRSANKAAHEVAGFVARDFGRYDWLGVGPSWLMDVILGDRFVTGSVSREESGDSLYTAGHSHIL
ncbi:hypothetical protein ABKV19_016632 [Rosa sericea]